VAIAQCRGSARAEHFFFNELLVLELNRVSLCPPHAQATSRYRAYFLDRKAILLLILLIFEPWKKL